MSTRTNSARTRVTSRSWSASRERWRDLDSLDLRRRQAVDDSLSFDEFLYRLLYDEVERRDSKQMASRLRCANFEGSKTFDGFDFNFKDPPLTTCRACGAFGHAPNRRLGPVRVVRSPAPTLR